MMRHGRRVAPWVVLLSTMVVVAGMVRGRAAESGSARAVAAASSSPWTSPPGGIDDKVFDLALGAASCAERAGVVHDPGTLTIIDYSRPSTERRLWVYDLRTHALLFREWVAHGKGSGDNVPTRFSNVPESHESSLGLFVTGRTYVGGNGYSLRLDGLDRGFNDLARARDIVVHGASYVGPGVAAALGRLGRSWGCPAVRPAVAHQLIDRIRGGGLLFAYYPDPKWLATSAFLGSCSAAGP